MLSKKARISQSPAAIPVNAIVSDAATIAHCKVRVAVASAARMLRVRLIDSGFII